MKKWTFFLLAVVLGCVCCFVSADRAQAAIFLLNGDLTLSGRYSETMYIRTRYPRAEKKWHKSRVNFWRSSFLMDGLYKAVDRGDYSLYFFGGFRYFYEKAPTVDSRLKRGIPRREYGEYIKPKKDDLLSELYVNFIKGPLDIRIGKQIITWGEMDLKRSADVINPLDLRYGSPGTEDWEDLKLGKYMLRAMYQTNLPGYLQFEVLANPGHFQHMKLPVEGTQRGPHRVESSFNPDRIFGFYHWNINKAYRDARTWDSSNWELGLKLRGYTWNVDWSVFYFNTVASFPIARPDRLMDYNMVYVRAGLRSLITDTRQNPRPPGYRVYDYKRYWVAGGTFQTIVPQLRGSEWRLEWFYERRFPYNEGEGGSTRNIYSQTRKDTFGFGINYADRFTLPYITRNWFNSRQMTVSLSMFYDKIFDHSRDLIVSAGRDRKLKDSSAMSFTYSIQQFFWQQKGLVMVVGSYAVIGKWFACPIIAYMPGQHWRFELAYVIYGSNTSQNKGLNSKDHTLLRVRYTF